MTSVQSRYAQRDNRLESVSLTGFITNNGTIDSVDNDPPQHPAYASINLKWRQNNFNGFLRYYRKMRKIAFKNILTDFCVITEKSLKIAFKNILTDFCVYTKKYAEFSKNIA